MELLSDVNHRTGKRFCTRLELPHLPLPAKFSPLNEARLSPPLLGNSTNSILNWQRWYFTSRSPKSCRTGATELTHISPKRLLHGNYSQRLSVEESDTTCGIACSAWLHCSSWYCLLLFTRIPSYWFCIGNCSPMSCLGSLDFQQAGFQNMDWQYAVLIFWSTNVLLRKPWSVRRIMCEGKGASHISNRFYNIFVKEAFAGVPKDCNIIHVLFIWFSHPTTRLPE